MREPQTASRKPVRNRSRRMRRSSLFAGGRIGVPRGIRTPVTAVKGRCPRPLDDGDAAKQKVGLKNPWWS